jgi:hypothetical protein
MARLLPKPRKPKVSKSEAAGEAGTKLKLNGTLMVPQAALFLGVHKYTLREFIAKGLINPLVVGARQYLDEQELVRVKRLLAEHGSLAKAYKHEQEQRAGANSDEPFDFGAR